MGRHNAVRIEPSDWVPPGHRRQIWGDLVPIEQYRCGGFPRHSADTITIPMTLEHVNPDVLRALTGDTTTKES